MVSPGQPRRLSMFGLAVLMWKIGVGLQFLAENPLINLEVFVNAFFLLVRVIYILFNHKFLSLCSYFSAAKSEMVKSKLPNSVLGKIWKLSDIGKDGLLDADEFALAMHLINVKLDGHDLPSELPDHLIPPSKRDL